MSSTHYILQMLCYLLLFYSIICLLIACCVAYFIIMGDLGPAIISKWFGLEVSIISFGILVVVLLYIWNQKKGYVLSFNSPTSYPVNNLEDKLFAKCINQSKVDGSF